MIKFGKSVVKMRYIILLVSVLLLIPAGIGYFNTKVNFDILSYLPSDIETMEGQEIMVDEFGTGAFSFLLVQDMEDKDVSALKAQIEEVDHVKKVLWYDSVADISIPMSLLPEDLYEAFNDADDNTTMMAIFYDDTMSADGTMDAIEEIRTITNEQCFLSGMSAVITDIKNLSDKETPIYVVLAVILAIAVLSLTMDSVVVPFIFILSIGMAIVYNMGTNVFKGEISYITQAIAAVLQLGVTMDYSIFLWHSYEENQQRYPGDKNRAMAHAISNTITSVVGSSITTVAGFIALCFMSFTLGADLGIVMAKGVVFGVICCVTVLPSMILVFDGIIEKTKHRPIIPDLGRISGWITKHAYLFLVIFVVILVPAFYGYKNTDVYYDLAGSLPDSLESIAAQNKLEEDFDLGATHMILFDVNMSSKDANQMLEEIKAVDGVKTVLAADSLMGPLVPKEMMPTALSEALIGDTHQMALVQSEYKVASDEVNAQCDVIKEIIKKYDSSAMLIGEAPCTEDLITITDTDFKVVSAVSIGIIFVIILLVFKSISLPIILVAVIEMAIFVNLGIPHYTGTVLPFIASVVISTIQLGATVDYAILMTNKYKKLRYNGSDKKTAVEKALESSISSVVVSAASFFAATFGVGVYSNIDMISSLCMLMARGAVISMLVVIFVLPSMFMIFDGIIIRTSMGFRKKDKYVQTEDAMI